MSRIRFRDYKAVVYGVRSELANACRMEVDASHDDIYAPVIDALDALLADITNEVNTDQWCDDAREAYGKVVLAMFSNSQRCDVFRNAYFALLAAGLDLQNP